MSALAELFPDGGYRFHLTLKRGAPVDFFRTRDRSGQLLAERAKWLAEDSPRYAALLPEGEALRAEVAELADKEWGLPHTATISALGSVLEPDFLLLSPDPSGAFRLRGGSLCFPTGWALQEKLGHTLDVIHGVVPGLNPALGASIDQFLTKLKPGVAFLRDNWGIVATEELNLHPARAIPPPALPVALDRLWLRVEHQALVALPRTGGVLFGIRIALHRLDHLALDFDTRSGLGRALQTMPAEVAAYKRLDAVREAIVALL